MTVGRWRDLRELVARLLDRPEAERAAFLDRELGDDPELRAEVEALTAVLPDDAFLSPPDIDRAVDGTGE